MIISSGTVNMGSARSFSKASSQGRSMTITGTSGSATMWNFSGRLMSGRSVNGVSGGAAADPYVLASVTDQKGKESFKNSLRSFADGTVCGMDEMSAGDMLYSNLKTSVSNRYHAEDEERSLEQIRHESLLYLLQRLRQILFGKGHEAKAGAEGPKSYSSNYGSDGRAPIASYSEYASYEETERTDFSTVGKVITADGREIDFNLSLTMSRSFKEEYMKQTDIYADNALDVMDPLVINLRGNIANVSDEKVFFDLDSDGELDSISRLNSDSGYLALDLNGDGIINDGSELFGTSSGDGFADLAKYDEDGNGWIDEADSIYSKLRIWVTEDDGSQSLYTLKSADVGAICLQKQSTDFALKSLYDNHTNGLIRETGVFLHEDGSVGTVQHLDLVR